LSREDHAEDDVEDEAEGPEDSLELEGEVRLDEGGIGEEGEEGACVRKGEEAVPDLASFAAGEPDLQERAGGGQEEEGQADGEGEDGEDGGDGVGGPAAEGCAVAKGFVKEKGNGQRGCGECEEGEVEALSLGGEGAAVQPVRVEVAEQERELKEDEAREPDRGGAAEGREELLGRHGLNQEEEKGREEDSTAVQGPG